MGPISAGGEKNYYLAHREDLLKAFHETNNGAWQYLAARDGEKLAHAVTREAASRFSSLLPRLPDVGGEQNIDTPYLPIAAWYLAYYQPMQAYGKTAADVGRMIYDLNETGLTRYPKAQALTEGARWFTRSNLENMQKWAAWTQKWEYPANWEATLIQGDGKDFDFGYDYQECAVVKYLQSQRASELAPYVCLNDFLKSRAFGTGLRRSKTLAQGDAVCNFRYKKGRQVTQDWDTEVPKFSVRGRTS
ncbi:MAG: L-2-amino-thiazoline-4-carboxylic acid hydrolase [Deltaproteobacteria bacterium]|nr:L-2-amino-thiazoline-4-carboxylic acid hydrolase [Deltaproteobacteria bacterium]